MGSKYYSHELQPVRIQIPASSVPLLHREHRPQLSSPASSPLSAASAGLCGARDADGPAVASAAYPLASYPRASYPSPPQAAQSQLQATKGATAVISPNLAAALTVAQTRLSQRKKQRDSVPPFGYRCRLCAIEGHWMENCLLYKSNKHPQYNNAARAVALNIISPDSEILLNSLPVVVQDSAGVERNQSFRTHGRQQQQPVHLPNYVQFSSQQQAQLQQSQLHQKQFHHQQTQQYHQEQRQHEQYLLHLQREVQIQQYQQSSSLLFSPTQSPDSAAGISSPFGSSRFEQIWMNNP